MIPRAVLALLAVAVVVPGCSDATREVGAPTTPSSDAGTSDDPSPTTGDAPVPSTTSAVTGSTTSTTTSTTTATTEPPAQDDGYPDQPGGVPWPTDEWAIAPLPAGIDSAAIDAAVDAAFGPDDNESRLRSIIAVHGGAIVYERYHPLDSADTIFSSYSVAKSVTSTLIGMLVDDGLLDVDAPAPVEEWQAPGDPRSAITLADLLHMSSGIDWTEAYGPDDPAGQMFRSSDWAEYVIERPLESEPGTTFEYSTGTTAVLGEILADQLGGPDALTAFIETELMEPLGITSTELVLDPTGQFAGGIGFDSTTRDFARFGLLVLRGGGWDGEQIVSADWLDYAATPSPTQREYGAQWWLYGPPNTLLAQGLFGQAILIAPELDLVVVVTSTIGGDSWTPMMTVHDQFESLG